MNIMSRISVRIYEFALLVLAICAASASGGAMANEKSVIRTSSLVKSIRAQHNFPLPHLRRSTEKLEASSGHDPVPLLVMSGVYGDFIDSRGLPRHGICVDLNGRDVQYGIVCAPGFNVPDMESDADDRLDANLGELDGGLAELPNGGEPLVAGFRDDPEGLNTRFYISTRGDIWVVSFSHPQVRSEINSDGEVANIVPQWEGVAGVGYAWENGVYAIGATIVGENYFGYDSPRGANIDVVAVTDGRPESCSEARLLGAIRESGCFFRGGLASPNTSENPIYWQILAEPMSEAVGVCLQYTPASTALYLDANGMPVPLVTCEAVTESGISGMPAASLPFMVLPSSL